MSSSKMKNILICESNEQHLQSLEQMILNFHKNSLQSMKLHCYSRDSEELQNDLILSAMFYIIILDFQFEGRNGVPLAKKVRQPTRWHSLEFVVNKKCILITRKYEKQVAFSKILMYTKNRVRITGGLVRALTGSTNKDICLHLKVAALSVRMQLHFL